MHKNSKKINNNFNYALKIIIGIFSITIIISIFNNTHSQSNTSIIPINLASTSLHDSVTLDKPTMALALSVEFPTVGAQYRTDTYSSTTEYIGYYYSKGCYQYIDTPTENPQTGKTKTDYKRFQYVSSSTTRTCSGETFSGNFLNWSSSSAIDMLRLALSGGDRYIDQNDLTVLQRAILPNCTPANACFWNSSSYFPAKKLTSSNNYSGAIPASMQKSAATKNIWVANILDRIYFRADNNSSGTGNATSFYKDYTLGKKDSSGKNGLNSDGFFYARVEVCKKSGDTVVDHKDFDLCTKYPNGYFKPTGVIQKYSDNLRIAAFGYLMDQSNSYGGVLRAPMKYVGAKTYNKYGKEEGANSKNEWDIQTGIFRENPENATDVANSGVINYLNKFGRTGPTPGTYKEFDTLGDLYYETLRYLQGLGPSDAAIKKTNGTSNITSEMKDGFTAYTTWQDPYANRSAAEQYSCLKSNIVVIADKNTHEQSWSSRTVDISKNLPDFPAWLKKASDYEKNKFSNSDLTTTNNRHQIVGYAYWAHANDIRGNAWTKDNLDASNNDKRRPGLRVKTFLFDVNELSASNDLNVRKKSNQLFLASKYGGYENDPKNIEKKPYSINEIPDFGIQPPNPSTSTPLKNDLVWQRTSGDASTYYLQSDARNVLSAFEEIFDRAASAAQSIAQSAATTSSISATTDSYIYTGTYDTASWTGNITAKKIVVDSITKNISLVADSNWDPAALLGRKNPENRNIVIGLGNDFGGTTGAIPFKWADITGTALEEHFKKSSPSATLDSLGSNRINYLRGSKTEEGSSSSSFRIRSSLMGDVINSGVTYSGKPSNKFIDPSYQLFIAANKNRTPIVITGANDGMLHAFAAEATSNLARGEEVFAYIPSWLAPKLPSLAATTYINNHQAFVDAPSEVGEAQLSFTAGAGAATDWKTVLVSGTGGGGRGVFALDITTPTSFSASNLLWEFTHRNDADLGYVVGRPKILKFKTGVNTYRWFAAVASGVNNYSSTFTTDGGSGNPAIFLLALDKPSNQAWELGTNYFKISLPLDSTLATTMAPGIVDFSMLWGAAGEVTQIYAGDLHGNLWKLDFTDFNTESKYKPTSEWNINKLSYFKKGTPAQALPFYQAVRNNNRQPISAAPVLLAGPMLNGLETFYVAFGTGKYLENSDLANTNRQSFYVLLDNGETTSDSSASGRTAAITGTSRLQAATIDTANSKINISNFIWGRPKKDTDAVTIKSGWYFDFPVTAERMIYSGTNIGSFNISFNSIIPGASQVNQTVCMADTASSNLYEINIASGIGKYQISQIGILGPSLFLNNEEKTSTAAIDSTGRAKRTIIQEEIASGTSGHSVRSASIFEMVGRLSWRQLYNYKELKHKITPATPTTPAP